MKITELYIKNFGFLSEKHFYFQDGVQVLYGENESGKSTLYAFIRAMLFGLERGRGKAAANDNFTRYEPWENPGNYGGMLWFDCGGKRFRLERSFSRGARRSALVCENDGEELSVEQGDLEMLLGGATASVYDSTVSIGQLGAEPGQELAKALENYAANFCETGGGDIDVNGVLQSLREKRKEAEKALQKRMDARQAEKDRLLQECSYLEGDMEELSRACKEKEKRLALTGARRNDASGRSGEMRRKPGRGYTVAGLTALAAGICAGVWGGLLGLFWKRAAAADLFLILAGAFLLSGAGALAAGLYMGMKDKKDEEERTFSAREREIPRLEEEARRLSWELEELQAQWKAKSVRCQNLKEQYEEMKPDRDQEKLAGRCSALRMAEEQMQRAAQELGTQISERMDKRASQILTELTEGRYQSIRIGQKLRISVWDGFRRIPAERLSRGTLEQIFFSLRMAAADILQEEPLPLILDETFAFYDEKRLESALKWLSRQKRQVIILTCRKREEEIIRRFENMDERGQIPSEEDGLWGGR